MALLVSCKIEEDPIKHAGARVVTTVSPLQAYESYLLLESDLTQTLTQAFPHPNLASGKM